jgi:hypothetical protein
VENSQGILEMIHSYTSKSFSAGGIEAINKEFLKCLVLIRKKMPQVVNENFYAELLCKSADQIQNFFDFFQEYLTRDRHDYAIVELLFGGFATRLPMLLNDFQTYKNLLVKNYNYFVGNDSLR